MLWALAAAGGLGLLIGLRYRVFAVVAASAISLVGTIAIAPFAAWPPSTTLAAGFGAVLTLQCGYLMGAGIAWVARRWRRGRSWRTLVSTLVQIGHAPLF